jgi:hypothetical protein
MMQAADKPLATFRLTARCRLSRLCLLIVLGLGCVHACAHGAQGAIEFETHGFDQGLGKGAPVFSLSISSDGTVVYEGRYRTRFSGEVQERVAPDVAARWLSDLVQAGALELTESADYSPPVDATWYRLTVSANDRRNSARFHGWNRSFPVIRVIDGILADLDVYRRWVNRDGAVEVPLPKRVR